MTKFEALSAKMHNHKWNLRLLTHQIDEILGVAIVPTESNASKQQAASAPPAKSYMNRKAEYKTLVWKLTNKQDLSSVPNIERRKWRAYDLDHIISIYDGFQKGIPAEVIASIDNLRIITHKENADKGIKSDYAANPIAGLLVPLK